MSAVPVTRSVLEELIVAPFGFDFFQAVRILEWQARRQGGDGSIAPEAGTERREVARRIGSDAPLSLEPVRFRSATDLSFPASALVAPAAAPRAAEAPEPGGPAVPSPAHHEMMIAFLGLTGPSGVLPFHYTDLVLRQARARNHALRAFFDLFNHRLAALFYRAWARHQLTVAFEQSYPGSRDPVSAMFAAFTGLGTPGLSGRLAVSDLTVLQFAGHFARTAPAAVSLEAILGDYFGLPVRIEQFRPRWIPLAEGEQSALPGPGRPTGRYAALGGDAVAGAMVFDAASAFRVRLGPMDLPGFSGFLPGESGLRRVADLVRLYGGPELDFDVQCVLRRDAVPPCRLACAPGFTPRLGWNTWLAWDHRDRDADDPVFQVEQP